MNYMLRNNFFLIMSLFSISNIYSQTHKRNVAFTVVDFKDTIISERTAQVHLRITNTSDTARIFSSYYTHPYEIMVYSYNEYSDTINRNPKVVKSTLDPFAPERFTILKPGESKEVMANLFGQLREKRLVKVKFVLPLNDLNKTFDNPETNWITQYFNLDYKEYYQKGIDEYNESHKKVSKH